MTIHISSQHDSGNIEVIDGSRAEEIRLAIRPDVGGEHYQWFHYRVCAPPGQRLRMAIENAGGASYPKGWEGYRACASYDRRRWFRVPTTSYDDGKLVIEHAPAHDSVFYAYFAPYSMERHRDRVARAALRPRTRLEVLGRSVDGQDLDLLTVGEEVQGRKRCWIIARQHPGETMAEWLMEGLVGRLQDPDDPVARALLDKAVFYLVPNMNPDGSLRGHLRVNATGANLNREWEAPTMERSPEVLLVRQRMDRTGVHFNLDVHGDEALPYNFIAGPDGVASVSAGLREARTAYEQALVRASPDFQTKRGYPRAESGKANMTMATNQIAHRYGALAMTLEQPFKDTADTPDEVHGWSPARARLLGRANLDALLAVVDQLPD